MLQVDVRADLNYFYFLLEQSVIEGALVGAIPVELPEEAVDAIFCLEAGLHSYFLQVRQYFGEVVHDIKKDHIATQAFLLPTHVQPLRQQQRNEQSLNPTYVMDHPMSYMP